MFNWTPKHLEEARYPTLVLSWFFGIGIIQCPLHHLKTRLSLCYLIVVNCIYFISLWYCFYYLFNFEWMQREEQLYLFFVGINVILMVTNTLIAWIHRHNTVQISKKSISLEEILNTLGLRVACLKTASHHTILMILTWFITICGLNSLALLWLEERTSFVNNIFMVLVFQHPMHANSGVELNFCSLIKDMSLRLKCINRLLLLNSKVKVNNWILDHYRIPSVTHSHQSKRKSIVSPSLSEYKPSINNINHLLQIMRYLHLEINVLCNRIMVLFGFQLCMALSITFLVITFLCYAIWLNVFHSTLTLHEKISRGVVIMGWLIIYILKLCIINHVCARTAAEYQRTGEIIHQIEIQSQDKQVNEHIQQFSIQIMQNPLVFSPCGVTELGYPFIKNFISTMTTYLVIVIQMSGDENTSTKNSNKATT